VGRLVHDEPQAVTPCQVEGVGEVLDIVLFVGRLSEPGDEWPLAESPLGLSGVNVAVPSSVPVTQNSSLVVKKVTRKTSFAATALHVPGAPVQGFVTGIEKG
jgi:hypothetical protein